MQHSTAQPTEDLLDSELATYAERAARRRARPSAAEVLGCTAAGLAFAGGDALGAIVHNSTGTTLSVSSIQTFFDIDIDGAGGADWELFLSGYADYGRGSAAVNGLGATVATGGGFFAPAIPLTPGAQVGPALASGVFNSDVAAWFYYAAPNSNGPFDNNTTGYLGLRFDGDTGTIGTQDAWVKVSFDYAAPQLTMNIQEWAYYDSGAAIEVGDTGVAAGPEPATPLLTLLGLGAMGVAASRRRREEGLTRVADEQGSAANAA
jgi:hypothetical protein